MDVMTRPQAAESQMKSLLTALNLLKRGDITANAEIRPGDILIIPQSWF